MELERLKQSFRFRSGRAKKPSKMAPKPQIPSQRTSLPNGSIKPAPEPPAVTPVKKKNNPTQAGNKDVSGSKPEYKKSLPPLDRASLNRPELPYGLSSVNGAARAPGKVTMQNPDRYGQSGVQRSPRPSPVAAVKERTVEAKVVSSSPDETDPNDFDLKPRPRKPKPPSFESLSDLLFSEGHLDTIVHDPELLLRLNAFLSRYKPDLSPVLLRYLETQKALKAVEYANAVVEAMTPSLTSHLTNEEESPGQAATIDPNFMESSKSVFSALLNEGLPAYITYQLVKIVTDYLTNDITGRSAPTTRDMVEGLSEIFCLTDPNQDDNPIIYASEEFYRLTGYNTNDVIGSNCRFLQGPKTNKSGPQRLREAQEKGEEACETMVNYRRDGRAFINLLMIAPLFDNQDQLKYYIGAQVNVSGLLEAGKSLDGFERFLAKRQREATRSRVIREETGLDVKKRKVLEKLKELSEMFDLEESAIVQSHSRSSSVTRGDDESVRSTERPRTARRILVDSDDDKSLEENEGDKNPAAWNLAASGPSGKLPGLYQSYLLLRPAPSLKVVFVSPALRKLGDITQSRFLSHVAAPSSTLTGLRESFEIGAPVTAKIHFLEKPGKDRYGTILGKSSSTRAEEDTNDGRACWISATPLLGADDEVGVWMVVMVVRERGASKMPSKIPPETPSTQRADMVRMPSELTSGLRSAPTHLPRSDAKPRPPNPRLENTNGAESKQSAPLRSFLLENPTTDTLSFNARQPEDYAHISKPFQRFEVDSGDGSLLPRELEKEEDVFVATVQNEIPGLLKENSNFITPSPPNELDEGDHSDHDQETVTQYSPPPEAAVSVSETKQKEDESADKQSESGSTPTKPTGHDDALRLALSRGPESNSARPQNMLYMDYLRHPGSGNQINPTGRASSNSSDDPECSRSPNSVD